ncbi:hypothetical protein V8G54_004643 [Vigna mungo]|uniref:Mediator of RNA polymerase II transcription subunit 6 n=1 Tax=Vigna mungo TaxID=3915 RepID=A0AAQ3PG71_VIGMU
MLRVAISALRRRSRELKKALQDSTGISEGGAAEFTGVGEGFEEGFEDERRSIADRVGVEDFCEDGLDGFELAMCGEGVEEEREGFEGVRGWVVLEKPLGKFEGQYVVVLKVEEEVFETKGCENGAQRIDGDEVQILASRFGKGSVRYGKEWLRCWGSVGCFGYQSAKSTNFNVSHCSMLLLSHFQFLRKLFCAASGVSELESVRKRFGNWKRKMATAPGNQMLEGGGAPPPPGTDMTGICFRDQLWLNSFPLDRNLVFDYFALSPFYDWTCNNEQLRMRSVHPLDLSQLSKMTGTEYMLSEVMEPHLFVIRKQKRDSPDKVTPMLAYYVLDGSIYQAPQLCNVFAARIGRALYYIQKAFTTAASKLEKIGYVMRTAEIGREEGKGGIWTGEKNQRSERPTGSVDSENETALVESKTAKETIDIKEVKRVDHILASLQRKLPPAPPPPPFPEGYVPPPTAEAEKGTETQEAAETQAPTADPIIDQGPVEFPTCSLAGTVINLMLLFSGLYRRCSFPVFALNVDI